MVILELGEEAVSWTVTLGVKGKALADMWVRGSRARGMGSILMDPEQE